ncbi:MAG: hypothetical protein OCC45_15450 [Desulfotalea sp.]
MPKKKKAEILSWNLNIMYEGGGQRSITIKGRDDKGSALVLLSQFDDYLRAFDTTIINHKIYRFKTKNVSLIGEFNKVLSIDLERNMS